MENVNAKPRRAPRMTAIPFRAVAVTAYALFIVPIIVFFFGWLKIYWSLLFSGVLIFGAVWLIKKDYWQNKDKINVPLKHLVILMIIFAVLVIFQGNCGVGASNYDTRWRTAVLRDLVEYDWPVIYAENECGLVYYLVFWMVPALAGKLFGLAGAFAVQWLYLFIIMAVSYLLILYLLKDYSVKSMWLIAAFLIMWSGVNILGAVIGEIYGWNPYALELGTNESYLNALYNGESFNFFYRSNEDFFTEIYNQALIWVAVPLFLQNRKISSFAFLGLVLFPFSPWGTIGLALMMIADAVRAFVKKPSLGFFKEVFSIPNICGIASAFFVTAAYFMSSGRMSASDSGGFGILTLSKMDADRASALIVFWFCEFGLYYLFTLKKFHKDFFYRAMLPMLMFIPLFWLGSIGGRDFCMDVSVVPLFVLMIYMIVYVRDEIMGKKLTANNFALLVCLILAAGGTPVLEWANKYKLLISEPLESLIDDSFYTYSNKSAKENGNFLAENPEDTFFYEYLAKIPEKRDRISKELEGIEEISDWEEYIDFLVGKDCTVFIAVRDNLECHITDEVVEKLVSLGFSTKINKLSSNASVRFVGAVECGNAKIEEVSSIYGILVTQKLSGYPVLLEVQSPELAAAETVGWISVSKTVSNDSAQYSAKSWKKEENGIRLGIKGADYSMEEPGVNLAVLDNKTGCVVDRIVFRGDTRETFRTDKPAVYVNQ